MHCDELRDRLDAYLAGELADRERAASERHLAECADCAEDLAAARAIAPAAAALPKRLPAPDLWPAIERRIRTRGKVTLPVWGLAAAALLLLALGATLSRITLPGFPAESASSAGSFVETESRYRELAAVLAADYRAAEPELAPETRRVVEANLEVIELALAETRRALTSDPRNRALEQMVLAAYQRKIEFLERVSSYREDGG
ncbi:MAG: zf-HC2 domain-containing protein [Gemmatimonadales bacterium]